MLLHDHASSYEISPEDPRLEHVRGVLRLAVGDRFDVGLANGPRGKASVCSLQPLRINVEWETTPPPQPPDLHLVVGMSRPATMRKILSVAPTLGVRSILVPQCQRSDPAYARASLWLSDEWQQLLWAGVEQAFDTFVPEVHSGFPLADLASRLPASAFAIAADVYAQPPSLAACDCPSGRPVVLAIGPERGWANPDRDLLRSAGFQLRPLGHRVMRVETAAVAGLSLLLAAIGGF